MYRNYPLHRGKVDAFMRQWTRRLLRIAGTCGLKRTDAILDYGCGAGGLVYSLRNNGYARAVGYDPYSDSFADQTVLKRQYDAIFCIETIEHVDDPLDLLDQLAKLLRPGGLLILSTPRADGIHLENWRRHLFALHAPYHRHIFSEAELTLRSQQRGLTLQKLRRNFFMFGWQPFTSRLFVDRYLAINDNVIDCFYERPRYWRLVVDLRFWVLGALGGLWPNRKDDALLAVFKAH